MSDRLAAARAARWPNGRQALAPKSCTYCGIAFGPKPWNKPGDWAATEFCSRRCSSKSRSIPLADRLRTKSARNTKTGCLEWTAYRDPKGYGRIGENQEIAEVEAHRAACGVAYGPIPPGMHVLHRCDNPPCIEPTHLFLGTNRDNVDDKIAKHR